LYMSLIASAVLLVVANVAVRRPGGSVLGGAAVVTLMLCGFFLGCFSPVLAVQLIGLGVAWAVWHHTSRKPSRYLALSTGATALAYLLIAALFLWPEKRRIDQLRAQYPMESMAARLPPAG